MPWDHSGTAPGILGLAVAVALAERLEAAGVGVAIKWPNDLLVDGRKLAGILPRMVYRGGRVRLARVGVGLNVWNGVPKGAIALRECPMTSLQAPPRLLHWTGELLMALDHALLMAAQPLEVCALTESRLWSRQVQDPETGEVWQLQGLREDGALLLRQGLRTTSWIRWADASIVGL